MKIWLIVVAWLLPIGAFAEDSCRDILTNGFFNEYSKTSAQSRDQAMYAELCSSSYQQAKDLVKRAEQSGGGGSLGVSYGLFGLSAGGSSTSANSFSEDRFNEWKSRSCSKNSSSDASRASEFIMQKVVAESVVNAWSACMQRREGLTCWSKPYHNEILLNINWKKTSLSQPVTQGSYLSDGSKAIFDGVADRKILPSGYKLSPGVLQIPITREKDEGIVANLNIVHDGVTYSCGLFIPGAKDFEVIQKPLSVQKTLESPALGCRVDDIGTCSGEWSYEAPNGFQVCTIELKSVWISSDNDDYIYKKPTFFSLKNPSRNGGSITWTLSSEFTGNSIRGKAVVTLVRDGQIKRDDGRSCNVISFNRM